MPAPMIATPRTELGDQTRLTAAPLDLTEMSAPSPKESNELLKQIRGMGGATVSTPRPRAPLMDRRNLPSTNEFTPLLKSATTNRLIRSNGFGKENRDLHTPIGLKPSYQNDTPALPLHSSMIIEEHTGESGAEPNGHDTTVPPVISSSSLSTPLAVLPKRGEGPLENGRNLATLREQEARLEQIDKENFSLKLKIHFMEEALRKNGKEFNEAAIKENTELKVDKVTLQRDLKQYRRSLAQAEKDLEDYKKQLIDYADQVNRRHASEGMQEEVDRLKRQLIERDERMSALQKKLDSGAQSDDQVEKLQDEVEDLLKELQEKERALDMKDAELESWKDKIDHMESPLQNELDDKERILEEKDEDIQALEDALQAASKDTETKLQEKDRLLEEKDDELRQLEDELKSVSNKRSNSLREKDRDLVEKNSQIQNLQNSLNEVQTNAKHLSKLQDQIGDLKSQLEAAEKELSVRTKKHSLVIEDKNMEIRSLQQRVATDRSHGQEIEELNDMIHQLRKHSVEKDQLIQKKEDRIKSLESELKQTREHLEARLEKAQQRVQELEAQKDRTVKELQALRDGTSEASADRNKALETARSQIQELEEQQQISIHKERQLQEKIRSSEDEIYYLQQRISVIQENQRQTSASDKSNTVIKAKQPYGAVSESQNSQHDSEGNSQIVDLQTKIQDLEDEVEVLQSTNEALQQQSEKSRHVEAVMQEKIQDLEDEIEVLQSTMHENARKIREELATTKQERETLRNQLQGLKQELAKASTEKEMLSKELEACQATLKSFRDTKATPSPQRALRREVAELTSRRSTLEQKLQESQDQLTATHQAKLEVEKQARGLRDQLQTSQSQAAQKLQTQVTAYEVDIQNLEQDLEEARAKQEALTVVNQKADQLIERLTTRIANLEKEVTTARMNYNDKETSIQERKDLHDMLKDAKLEAEDLALQLREKTSRIEIAASTEAELRAQLKKAREERANQSSRAETATKELQSLQSRHDELVEQVEDMKALQRQVRFPKSSITASINDTTSQSDKVLERAHKRHAAELRGMVKQIEYLGARCRREEAFRQDLSYSKAYFLKQVEMYGACNKEDLRLAKAMGIPTDDVLERETWLEVQRNGLMVERAGGKGLRPGLRTVALMVLAAVRMRKAAARWGCVRKGHDGLLKKLAAVRMERKVGVGNGKTVPPRKARSVAVNG